jgi:hypothetical protein
MSILPAVVTLYTDHLREACSAIAPFPSGNGGAGWSAGLPGSHLPPWTPAAAGQFPIPLLGAAGRAAPRPTAPPATDKRRGRRCPRLRLSPGLPVDPGRPPPATTSGRRMWPGRALVGFPVVDEDAAPARCRSSSGSDATPPEIRRQEKSRLPTQGDIAGRPSRRLLARFKQTEISDGAAMLIGTDWPAAHREARQLTAPITLVHFTSIVLSATMTSQIGAAKSGGGTTIQGLQLEAAMPSLIDAFNQMRHRGLVAERECYCRHCAPDVILATTRQATRNPGLCLRRRMWAGSPREPASGSPRLRLGDQRTSGLKRARLRRHR